MAFPPSPPTPASTKDHDLVQAAKAGDIKEVRRLVADGASVNAVDRGATRWSALYWAAASNQPEVIEALVALGADIEIRSAPDRRRKPPQGQRTPLHVAAAYGHPKAVETLLKLGADASARDQGDSTPLMLARKGGPLAKEAADVLMKHGLRAKGYDKVVKEEL